ncbi:hypothetical protein [Nocardia sp. NPDC024068]
MVTVYAASGSETQEWFTSPAGTVMMRDITVDERDANTRIVRIDFRGV